jgi:molybdopterin converting factor subunit 1
MARNETAMLIHIQYFAVLREKAGRAEERLETAAATPADLYEEVRQAHGFNLPRSLLKVAINDEFCEWSQRLQAGDRVVFIPPVAGG